MADIEPGLHEMKRSAIEYKSYKRRFFGLAQLVLLNIVVSWNWLTFAANPEAAAEYFNVDPEAISWLSTVSLFAFLVSGPIMLWALNHHGPKYSVLIGSGLVLLGTWVRCAAAWVPSGKYPVVMTGQIIIALAQPFVLAVSTRYSNLWFSDQGRITATAAVSLANPFGGALGEVVGPFIAAKATGIPNLLLYVAIVSTIATIPAPFIPKQPPTPPSAAALAEKLDFKAAIRDLCRNRTFWLILVPFQIYAGLFNATSTLFAAILVPYGFSQSEAGIAGGILILAGLLVSAIVSPILDRTKAYRLSIGILIPCIAACYTVLIFIPGTHSIAGLYAICALLGGLSFSLMPMTLELFTVITQPVSPEVSSVVAWAGGDVLGGVFIISMNAMRASSGWAGEPPGTMIKGLILAAALAWVAVPAPLFLAIKKYGRMKALSPDAAL